MFANTCCVRCVGEMDFEQIAVEPVLKEIRFGLAHDWIFVVFDRIWIVERVRSRRGNMFFFLQFESRQAHLTIGQK